EEARGRVSIGRGHGRALRPRGGARLPVAAGSRGGEPGRGIVRQAHLRADRQGARNQDTLAHELLPQAGPERGEPATADAIDGRPVRELGAAGDPGGTMTAIPLLTTEGDAYARGLAHGQRFGREIADNVETYLRRFAASGLDREAAFVEAERWLKAIGAENRSY